MRNNRANQANGSGANAVIGMKIETKHVLLRRMGLVLKTVAAKIKALKTVRIMTILR